MLRLCLLKRAVAGAGERPGAGAGVGAVSYLGSVDQLEGGFVLPLGVSVLGAPSTVLDLVLNHVPAVFCLQCVLHRLHSIMCDRYHPFQCAVCNLLCAKYSVHNALAATMMFLLHFSKFNPGMCASAGRTILTVTAGDSENTQMLHSRPSTQAAKLDIVAVVTGPYRGRSGPSLSS